MTRNSEVQGFVENNEVNEKNRNLTVFSFLVNNRSLGSNSMVIVEIDQPIFSLDAVARVPRPNKTAVRVCLRSSSRE